MKDRAKEYLVNCVRIDTRSLAVFRVFAGALIVVDLLLRSRNFGYFYTNEGAVSSGLAAALAPADLPFSVYLLSPNPTVTALLFVVQALFALQLIVGYRTRFATVVSFLLVVSLDFRNPFVLSYADTLFRLLLFWAIFLPLGERWSVDAVHRRREPRRSFVGVAGALALGQMVTMYFVNGYQKTRSESWVSGEAAPMILERDDVTFFLADVINEFQTVLGYGGIVWYYMLLFSWLLILLVGRKRAALVVAFFIAHASFAVTVRIGAFPYVAMAGLVLFVQTPVWEDADRLSQRLRVEFDRIQEFGADVGSRLPDVRPIDIDNEIRENAYTYSVAGIAVAVVLVTVILFPAVLGVGEGDDLGERVEYRMDDSAFVGVVSTFAETFGVAQPDWSVFAPDPVTENRYYVFPAETADGELVDARNNRSLNYERPHDELQRQYETYRERFYMDSLSRLAPSVGYDENARRAFEEKGEYVCDRWAERGTELVRVNMYLMVEEDRSIVPLYRHGCGDNEAGVVDERLGG